MKKNIAIFLVLVILSSLACTTAEIFSKPTPTPLPTSTDTPTITPTITPTKTSTKTPTITPSATLIPIKVITMGDGTILVIHRRYGYQYSMPEGERIGVAGIYDENGNLYQLAMNHIEIASDESLDTILANELANPGSLNGILSFAENMAAWVLNHNSPTVNPVIVNYGKMTNAMDTPLAFAEFYYPRSRGYTIYFIPVENMLVKIEFGLSGQNYFTTRAQQLTRMIQDTIQLIEP